VWDTLYRPLRYADVLGQEGNVELLKARIRNKTAFDTSYVFSGRHGRGKTTLGRIHARAMLCLNINLKDPEPCNECDNCKAILQEQPSAYSERDSANQASADEVRAIIEILPCVLENAPKRIYLFDEAQSMSKTAQDALLKPLEEKRMVGMFCTTEVEKLRGAIRSRCEEYPIRKVPREKILERMRIILDSQSVQYEDEAVLTVIDHQGGHIRDVINTLEAIAQIGPIRASSVRDHLHLPSVTIHYQLLLSLDNPTEAFRVLDQACEIETPEDVASGLAEAAMNSFRTAHRMVHDFSQVDKALAEQVYAKYQNHVTRFARWFLARSRDTTKNALQCDILEFSQNKGNLPSEGPQPPVIFMGTATPAPSVAEIQAAPEPSLPEAAPEPQPSVPVAQSPAKVQAPPPKPAQQTTPSIPASYIDPTEPTEIEAAVINRPLQRQRSSPPPDFSPRQKKGTKSNMTPIEWKESFERWYKKRRPG
jgi:DNA polymerase III subunit gamma/tau